jgi:putative ubiquitin-RnfH superfamily antitoxin RatB of RatAB toxin-antitoxin module
MSGKQIRVEVVFARPDQQSLVEVSVNEGATVGEAIEASGLREAFADDALESLPVGIWGRLAERSARVRPGDRVEIYRPLELDPKSARRELALLGLTMKDTREQD